MSLLRRGTLMQASLAEDDFDDSARVRARLIARAARRDRSAPYANLQAYTEPQKHRNVLETRLEEAILQRRGASELLLCLFTAALNSYRRGTICDPFPPFFIQGDRKLFDDVEILLNALPSLEALASNPRLIRNLPPQALSLLDWILNPAQHAGFSVDQVPVEQYEVDVSASSGRSLALQSKASKPDLVFKINYHSENEWARLFAANAAEHGALTGYHGSPAENFHSIIHNGLDDTFSRSTSIFGEGVYLSEDRDVGYSFVKASKIALGDCVSALLGDQFGMLACCEVAKHPQVRHSHKTSTKYRDSAILVDGQNQLPPGYVVVTQPQHILIRYLLVYTSDRGAASRTESKTRKVNVCQFMFVLYVILLFLLAYFKYRNSVAFVTLRHSLGL